MTTTPGRNSDLPVEQSPPSLPWSVFYCGLRIADCGLLGGERLPRFASSVPRGKCGLLATPKPLCGEGGRVADCGLLGGERLSRFARNASHRYCGLRIADCGFQGNGSRRLLEPRSAKTSCSDETATAFASSPSVQRSVSRSRHSSRQSLRTCNPRSAIRDPQCRWNPKSEIRNQEIRHDPSSHLAPFWLLCLDAARAMVFRIMMMTNRTTPVANRAWRWSPWA